MQSRTLYAVLGMLCEGPKSGYDLKKEFEERVRHFWSESVGQIYPALKRAGELGWARARKADRGGRARTEYSLTPKGRAAFEQWSRQEPGPLPVRNELLLKIFFGSDLDLEVLREHVERFEEEQRTLRRNYATYVETIERSAESAEQTALWKLTLSSGQHVNRARLAWCREARQVLAELEQARSKAGA